MTHNVLVERSLKVKMPDGVELLTDHYYANNDGAKDPIILVRSPYGRNSVWGLSSRIVAERGYQVVLQSARGTFGSGGEFEPEVNEARDGISTMEWLRDQKWFSGKVAMMGPSYLGYVQWAIATSSPPDYLRTIVPWITASQFRSMVYPGESLALDTYLSWAYLIYNQERLGAVRMRFSQRRSHSVLKPAFDHVPLNEADELVVGTKLKIFQNILTNNLPGATYWKDRDHSKRVKDVAIPVHLVGGWYDIFLPYQLSDYASLKASGKTPFLTIGPWTHESLGAFFTGLRESISWFDAYLRDDRSKLRTDPVSIYLMGANRWLSLSEWPPPEMKITRWNLNGNKSLDQEDPPDDSPPDTYNYDPKDPTPSIGGIVLGADAGPRDNRKLERRTDVLSYTSLPVEKDYIVAGPVSVELYVESSLEYTDFFARLCDVSPDKKSKNVCDGLIRLGPSDFEKYQGPDGIAHISFDLWPTAYCFLKTHRLRLQVSSGSHPRFMRNLGSAEPLATAVNFRVANQKIFHDANHPSSILLPVCDLTSSK